MPVSNKIQVEELRAAITDAELDITIGSSIADTDDALFVMFKLLEAFSSAQNVQNVFAPTGEDVQAISIVTGEDESTEYPPGSGVFLNTRLKVYTVEGNAIIGISGVVPPLA